MTVLDLVFDLDGTLIDSAPGILVSMQAALEQSGIVPKVPLTSALIGPPLIQALQVLAPDASEQTLARLAEDFKRHYDGSCHHEILVYPGIAEALHHLSAMPVRMHLATNKRLTPTLRIMEHLGWGRFFSGIYTLDSFSPPLQHKAAMLERIRQILQTPDRHIVYVGDREEDAEASRVNAMPFLWASWGYGNATESIPPQSVLRIPQSLLQIVQAATTDFGADQ